LVSGRDEDRLSPQQANAEQGSCSLDHERRRTDQRCLWRHSDEGGALSWSPDSRRIAVTSDSDIYVISADGSGKLVGRGDDVDPAWQPMPGGA
jgi:hypothetical protein